MQAAGNLFAFWGDSEVGEVRRLRQLRGPTGMGEQSCERRGAVSSGTGGFVSVYLSVIAEIR